MSIHFLSRIRASTPSNPFDSILKFIHNWNPNPRKTLAMAVTQPNSKRPTCPSCSKPVRLCLCTRIRTPGIENKVRVTILQHSLERKHPLNSTRIVKLGLKNVTLATVTDVLFDARFIIRLLESNSESGSCRNDSRSSDSGKVLVFEDVGGFDSEVVMNSLMDGKGKGRLGNGDAFVENLDVLSSNGLVSVSESELLSTESIGAKNTIDLELNDKTDVSKLDKSVQQGCDQDAVITTAIGKYGVVSGLDHIWLPQTDWEKPTFDQILASQVAMDALAKGFVVRKLQKRQVNGRVELEEFQEFDLEVPAGSVLLFPSEKAVGVDDLEAVEYEVRNLVVLDGTWAKARRMYIENPWLKLLPHLKLEVDKMSLYSEVRQQPKAGYLSTIESIVYALKAVGDDDDDDDDDDPKGLDNLLEVFESMVEDQRRCKDERLSKVSDS